MSCLGQGSVSASVPALPSDHRVPERRGPTVRPPGAQNSTCHSHTLSPLAAHLADEEPGGRGGDDAREEPESPGDAHEEAGVPAGRMARAHCQRSWRPFLQLSRHSARSGRCLTRPEAFGATYTCGGPDATSRRVQNQNQGAMLSSGPRCPPGGYGTGQLALTDAWVQIGLCLGWRQAHHPTFCAPRGPACPVELWGLGVGVHERRGLELSIDL